MIDFNLERGEITYRVDEAPRSKTGTRNIQLLHRDEDKSATANSIAYSRIRNVLDSWKALYTMIEDDGGLRRVPSFLFKPSKSRIPFIQTYILATMHHVSVAISNVPLTGQLSYCKIPLPFFNWTPPLAPPAHCDSPFTPQYDMTTLLSSYKTSILFFFIILDCRVVEQYQVWRRQTLVKNRTIVEDWVWCSLFVRAGMLCM